MATELEKLKSANDYDIASMEDKVVFLNHEINCVTDENKKVNAIQDNIKNFIGEGAGS